ncbi:MAG: hypothetical protein E7264_06750 [Lachnospiraceae bacterium]|nr:hypothetical protein [Lachnospiraceae bacterium]
MIMCANFESLKQNIIDSVEEQQLKLGYLKETVRLYYPLSSLNRFLQVDATIEEMTDLLQRFSSWCTEELGGVGITNKGERFCIAVPPAGADYVHQHICANGFLNELIETVRMHGTTWEDLFHVFQKHSDSVCVEEMHNGEFQYLVYFQDGIPDDYRYCIAVEADHVTYHRYTPADYEDFGF